MLEKLKNINLKKVGNSTLKMQIEKMISDLESGKTNEKAAEKNIQTIISLVEKKFPEAMNKETSSTSKKATLTAEEDKAWVNIFEYYINEGKSDTQADKLAWKDLQEQFPRLKNYSGINDIKAKTSKQAAKASKAKYKKGDKVHYTEKLSGFNNKTVLIVESVKYDAGEETGKPGYFYTFKESNLSSHEDYLVNSKKGAKASKADKPKTKTSYKASGKDVDEMDCEELEKLFKERKAKAKKSEKKSKTRPVIEKIVSNVATATKQAIDSVSVEDIKKDPKKFIEKCMKAEKSGEEFINDLKSLLGEEYDKSEVSEGMEKILIHIKQLKAKYVK